MPQVVNYLINYPVRWEQCPKLPSGEELYNLWVEDYCYDVFRILSDGTIERLDKFNDAGDGDFTPTWISVVVVEKFSGELE